MKYDFRADIPKYRVDGCTGLIFVREIPLRAFVSFVLCFLPFPISLVFFRKIIGRCVRFRNYPLRVDTVRRDINCTVRDRAYRKSRVSRSREIIHGESFYTSRNRGFLNNVLTVLISRRSTRRDLRTKENAQTILFRDQHHSGRVSFSNRVTTLIRRTDTKRARLIQRKS